MSQPASLSLAPGTVPTAGAAAPLRERLAATPRLACEALARAIKERDLEAALACFSPGACLFGPDGTVAQGEQALSASLARLIDTRAHVAIELRGVIVAADIALAHERWRIDYGGRPDPPAASASGPTLVLRLIAGEWKVAIAAPWGTPASEPLRAIWP